MTLVSRIRDWIVELLRWLFIYVPARFTIPMLVLSLWLLLTLGSWFVDVLKFEYLRPFSLDTIARLGINVLVLSISMLVAYNGAVLHYKVFRPRSHRKRNGLLMFECVLFAGIIYTVPWAFSPNTYETVFRKGWGWCTPDRGAVANLPLLECKIQNPWCEPLEPFYWLYNPCKGIHWYGVTWFVPLLPLVGLLLKWRYSIELRNTVRDTSNPPRLRPTNAAFEDLRKSRQDLRIGIILAGGGAKGAYQAGAMQAIHEFLEAHDALSCVKVIAGTSIGSWNALFWLGGLVGRSKDGQGISDLEKWWCSAGLRRLVDFGWYFPGRVNSVLSTEPWQENFDEIFGREDLNDVWARLLGLGVSENNSSAAPIHFYFTRSNVRTARLEFCTNNAAVQPSEGIQEVEPIPRSLADLRDAVFASMDLPPLFPYHRMGNGYYEDGGVIDNLPTIFGTSLDACDLLFVLPLNASFEAQPQSTLATRMLRVLDVRQGALERKSMELIRLRNELNTATGRKLVNVLSICPGRPLSVKTAEFWKTQEFAGCFRAMYEGTSMILRDFQFNVPLGTWLVDQNGTPEDPVAAEKRMAARKNLANATS